VTVSDSPARALPSDGVMLAVEDSGGDGRPIVLAHGLTATRRYVLHGSHLLEREGYRVVTYDARGHGESTAAPDPAAYRYTDLVDDLEAVLDGLEIDKAVLAGVSMGAATALALALRRPQRVSALVEITPAYSGSDDGGLEQRLHNWDALADGLEREGVDGFMRAYGEPPVDERFKGIVTRAIRQRIERHDHPAAVAAALRAVPRSAPFDSVRDLERVRVPTLVVASRDEADPEHPYAVAVEYAERIPDSELVSEEPGASPLAWRGAQLSRVIASFLERRGLGPRS
jgi:pimeloyl-ACP methyl ester carboxylesterase